MKYCTIQGCKDKNFSRNWCSKHYNRWYRNGDPLKFKNARQNARHGMSYSSEYRTWYCMISRCYNKNNVAYKDYGGRGITVCDKWRNSFTTFYKDMGERPSPNLTLDRINNDGSYEPNNCRWATRTEQNINQRVQKNNTSGVPGVYWYKPNNKWSVRIAANNKRINLGYFVNKQDAINARFSAEKIYHEKSGWLVNNTKNGSPSHVPEELVLASRFNCTLTKD